MTCKIDHTLEGMIPKVICRACNPGLASRTPAPPAAPGLRPPVTADLGPAAQARYNSKVKRKLRAEVKAWRERIEAMERSHIDPRDIAKAQATLRKAENDLYMVA